MKHKVYVKQLINENQRTCWEDDPITKEISLTRQLAADVVRQVAGDHPAVKIISMIQKLQEQVISACSHSSKISVLVCIDEDDRRHVWMQSVQARVRIVSFRR